MSEEKQNPDHVLSISELFGAATYQRRIKKIGPLPIVGGYLFIRSWSEKELGEFQAASMATSGKVRKSKIEDGTRRAIARSLCDEAGQRIMADADAGKLAGLDAAVAKYIENEVLAHVGLDRDDIEDLAKNSEKTDVDASS